MNDLVQSERSGAQYRHALHYLEVLATADDMYLQGGALVLRSLELFDLERENILAGHTWAATHSTESSTAATLSVIYPDAGTYILGLRLSARDRIPWLEVAVSATQRLGDQLAESAHLGKLGIAHYELGEYPKAIEYHEHSLAIKRELGYREGEGNTLGNLGIAYFALGEYRKAAEYHEQALAISQELRNRRAEGIDLMNLGNAFSALGESQKAIEYHKQSHLIKRELGDLRGEGEVLGNLGNVYYAVKDWTEAIGYYEQALVVARRLGDQAGQGAGLSNLGHIYVTVGEYRKAITCYELASSILHDLESPAADEVAERLEQLQRVEWTVRMFGKAGEERSEEELEREYNVIFAIPRLQDGQRSMEMVNTAIAAFEVRHRDFLRGQPQVTLTEDGIVIHMVLSCVSEKTAHLLRQDIGELLINEGIPPAGWLG